MYFTYNLDDMENLFFELENVQDGVHGHKCTIKADNPREAAEILSSRLVSFFEKNMSKSDKDGYCCDD